MSDWTPLNLHSNHSILMGIPSAEDLVGESVKRGYKSVGLTDIHSLGSSVAFFKKAKEASLKPLLGNEFPSYILFAQNLQGWKNLIKISALGDSLFLVDTSNLIVILKYPYDNLIRSNVNPDFLYAGIDANLPLKEQREKADSLNLKRVALNPTFYIEKKSATDQRLLLCNKMKTTLKNVAKTAQSFPELLPYLSCNDYYWKTEEEVLSVFTDDEIRHSKEIGESIDSFNILSPPKIPKFGVGDANSLLREICLKGWNYKIKGKGLDEKLYGERVKKELEVIREAGIADYFLIVQDAIRYIREEGYIVGPGRGCLTKDTDIILEDGTIKSIDSISVGDSVITIDGSIQIVEQIHKYPCDEYGIQIFNYYGDSKKGLTLTSDHKLYIQKRNENELSWTRADQVENGDWLFFPKPEIQIKNIQTIDLSKYCNNDEMIFSNEKVIYKLKGLKSWNCDRIINSHDRFIDLDTDWYRILGFWVGNGSLRSNGAPHIVFSFHSDKVQLVDFIENKFKKLNIKTHRHTQPETKSTQLYIHSIYIYKLFKELHLNYNSTPDTKHIPKMILETNEENIKSYVDGYFEADGTKQTRGGELAKSVSLKLANQIRFLLLRLRWPCTIAKIINKDKRPEFQNCKNCYSLYRPIKIQETRQLFKQIENGLLCKVRKVSKSFKISELVYDLSIKKNHNYLTTCCLVHNSVGGSLCAYLTDITKVDSIQYGLIFERFYNSARKGSLMDIDVDIPKQGRPKLIKYVTDKYGKECVCGMGTFSRMMGRCAVSDVLRIHSVVSFEEMKRITDPIPDESKISDQLQDMEELEGESSIIRWSLENKANALREWVYLEDGELKGPMSPLFAQAIRLEGCIKESSKHASGTIIANEPIYNFCPMMPDKSQEGDITAVPMGEVEATGGVKFDFLTLNTLDKLMEVQKIVREEHGLIN